MELSSIGNRIAELRKNTNVTAPVTQEALATAVGVSVQAVSKWENGGTPDVTLIPAIANFFGVSIDYLFGQEKNPTTQTNTADVQKHLATIAEVHHGGSGLSNTREMGDAFFSICYAAYNMFVVGTPDSTPTTWKEATEIRLQHYTQQMNEPPSSMLGHSITDGARVYFDTFPIPFFTIMPEPENGWREVLPNAEEFATLFAALSCPATVKALLWLMQQDIYPSQFTLGHMAASIGANEEKAQEILDFMLAKKLVVSAEIELKIDGVLVPGYMINKNSSILLPLFTLARLLIVDVNMGAYGFRWNTGCTLV